MSAEEVALLRNDQDWDSGSVQNLVTDTTEQHFADIGRVAVTNQDEISANAAGFS